VQRFHCIAILNIGVRAPAKTRFHLLREPSLVYRCNRFDQGGSSCHSIDTHAHCHNDFVWCHSDLVSQPFPGWRCCWWLWSGVHVPATPAAASWLVITLSDDDVAVRLIEAALANLTDHLVGNRFGRVEPRAVKRRPKEHALLTKPRAEARAALLAGKRP
jgi:hypothetical protein